MSSVRQIQAIAVAIAVALLLTACSRVEFAYEYGDWFAARGIASYLDLDRAQRQDVRGKLQAYRSVHRETRLPTMVVLMDDTSTLLKDENPDPDTVRAHFDRGMDLLTGTVEDVIPMAADTLRSLTPAQIDHLETQLADGRREYAEDIAPNSAERLTERVEQWVGDLSIAQRVELGACDARTPDVTDQWLQWREQRDDELTALLRSGATQGELETFLREWWLDSDARPEALQQARARTRDIWLGCTRSLLAGLSSEQRDHARNRLQGYRDDFQTLASR